MAFAYFPSVEAAEALEVAFVKPAGEEVILRLLVDSGFTGQSSFVLPESAADLAHAQAAASRVAGALQGTQTRVVVSSRITALSFRTTGIAILADISGLALPAGVVGLVGLQFLRHFRRWGAERTDDGAWRFFLQTDAS
jgi:predicted aspartyl protease